MPATSPLESARKVIGTMPKACHTLSGGASYAPPHESTPVAGAESRTSRRSMACEAASVPGRSPGATARHSVQSKMVRGVCVA